MPRTLEDTLASLRRLKREGAGSEGVEELRAILSRETSLAVARAAEVVEAHAIDALSPALTAAFPRFLRQLPKSDPGCAAKTAIVRALRRLDVPDDATFLAGVRHVQMEPVFGGRIDTAGELRAESALALVAMRHPDGLTCLADLLADPLPAARAGAARALAGRGTRDGAALLRLRVRVGEPEPSVIVELVEAMVRLDPVSSLPLAADLLRGPDAEAVAVGLGASGEPGAWPVLRDWHDTGPGPALERTAIDAIGALRVDEAIAWLVELVASGEPRGARAAVSALAARRHDAALRERVAAAVAGRDDPALLRDFEASWPPEGR
jgi:hypothetical protein